MDKKELTNSIRDFRKTIQSLKKDIEDTKGNQIQTKSLLSKLEESATKWFEEYESILRSSFKIEDDIISKYHNNFGKILEICGGRPSKKILITLVDDILSLFHLELIVPIQKYQEVLLRFPEFDTLLENVDDIEKDYLSEAIECARLGKIRASIILGWGAAVSRLHSYIQSIGFDKFNEASQQMFNINTGRYKRFKKKFEVQNITEVRMNVFDNDLLWILEFLGAIDGNQHEKLEICFTMRNTCAHPGEAIYGDENALSFFYDINKLVFSNLKFKV